MFLRDSQALNQDYRTLEQLLATVTFFGSPALAVTSVERTLPGMLSPLALCNGTIADKGVSHDNQTGGQCKVFAQTVVREAGGTLGAGYRQCYFNAGGTEISPGSALRGDFIQLNNDSNPENYYDGMHTAIVLQNLGSGNYQVVDSNWNLDEIVHIHNWNPSNQASSHGLSAHFYRLGLDCGGALSASWQNPSSGGQTVSGSVRLQANVSGGSGGINRVSFSANYNGGWKGLATVYSAPYQFDWNLCSPQVQNGDVELGMEVWDNAGNKWVYSDHHANYHINVQNPNNCGGSTGTWRAEYYDSQDMWWDPNNTNWHSCGEDLSGPTLDKNYGTSAPCSGMRNNGDQWVGDYRGRITFSPGTYVFYSDHDDGARLWVEGLNNNNPIMEAGGSGSSTMCNGQTGYYLDGGKNIRVVLREEGGDARIKLWWDTNTATCLPKCYSLSTSATPSGSGSIGLDPQPNCAGGYTDGTNVQLTANPYSGYAFANWSGDLSGATSPTSITVNGNKSVTANFVAAKAVTVDSVWISDANGNSATTFNAGDSINFHIGATNQMGSTQPSTWNWATYNSSGTKIQSLSFDNWQYSMAPGGSGAGWPAGIPIDLPGGVYTFVGSVSIGSDIDSKQTNFTVVGAPCYTLSTGASPSSSGQVSVSPAPNCDNGTKYRTGTSVQLTASATSGYTFANWSGDATGTANPVSVTMNGNKTVTANFTNTITCYTLTKNVNPSGSGTVSASPAPNCESGTKYTSGTLVQLTGSANSGYSFANWAGDLAGTTNPGSLTINGNKTVTANFTANAICYTLTTSVNPSGGGSVGANPAPNCGSKYTAGTVVQLTANAHAGHYFVNWSGAVSGSSISTTITMDRDKMVVANLATEKRIYLPLVLR
jgi:uncharacterized repeat protein (TIGR02543 family)